jgi:DNA-binding helix-hairpin-helix protein with protein kinase domain
VLRDVADGARFLNLTGYGHADLSGRNILCNPVVGKGVIIDLDGLVVPDFMKGNIIGTRGFMAPELADSYIGLRQVLPSAISDRHALAVIIYHTLLWRHPLLDGMRTPLHSNSEINAWLCQSTPFAIYVDHPTNSSNRPQPPSLPVKLLGNRMVKLFEQAFVAGITTPNRRPSPYEWVTALNYLIDDVVACRNPDCLAGYFPSLDNTVTRCPFCGTTTSNQQHVVRGASITQIQAYDRHKQLYTFEIDSNNPLAESSNGVTFMTIDKRHIVKIYKKHLKRPQAMIELILKSAPDPNHEAAPALAWITHAIPYKTADAYGVITPNVAYQHWMLPLVNYLSPQNYAKLAAQHKGNYQGFVQLLIQVAKGMRYLNSTGYGHADLSGRTILCNPVLGKAAIISLDDLVVPEFMTSNVLGTPGYMAPELIDNVLGSNQVLPSIQTDRFALSVIIFQLLLRRHPLLDGVLPPLDTDPRKNDLLRQSSRYALYVHHPTDTRNRPNKAHYLAVETLGHEMTQLFEQAFVDGLHIPTKRPSADDWVIALKNLLADLVPCPNSACPIGYFASLKRTATACPICHTAVRY